jgi:hypothetical protein
MRALLLGVVMAILGCAPPSRPRPVAPVVQSTEPAAPPAPPPQPAVPKAAATTGDRLDAAAIQRIVRLNFGEFRRCYEEHLTPCPNLQGRVTIRFVIGRHGEVVSAADAGSDLGDSRTVACVVRAVKALSFPAPKSGPVTVQYPFLFTPGGD